MPLCCVRRWTSLSYYRRALLPNGASSGISRISTHKLTLLPTSMDRNPYAPPAAIVSDAISAPLLERPLSVKRGILLLWISFAFGLLNTGWGFYTEPQDAVWTIVLLVVAIAIFGLCALVIRKISQRRNWARVLYLILAIISYSILIYSYLSLEDAQTDIIVTLLETAAMFTDIAGVALIFTPSANRWFGQQV
jgi:hypothetical protein